MTFHIATNRLCQLCKVHPAATSGSKYCYECKDIRMKETRHDMYLRMRLTNAK